MLDVENGWAGEGPLMLLFPEGFLQYTALALVLDGRSVSQSVDSYCFGAGNDISRVGFETG